MTSLDGKIAVITGGTSGIGLATAKAFEAEGARVVVFGRNPETLGQARSQLRAQTLLVQGDVASTGDLQRLFDEVKVRFGRVDVLFANAGITKPAPLEAITEELYRETFNVNFGGTLFTVQRSLPLLGDGASVILTSTNLVALGMPGMAVYAASKAAVNSLARTLSAELVGRGIRVNVLSPGPTNTPIYGKLGLSEAEVGAFAASVQAQVPMGRFASPEEIAQAAVFLASGASGYMLGAELVLDGGWSQL